MFNGNKLVLILPGILMIVMLIGGYQFLKGSEAVTNEQLQELVESQVKITEVENGLHVDATWDWTTMPIEGLYGEDYIGIYVLDRNTGEARLDVEVKDRIVQLLHADQVIEEESGTQVDNGIIFTFSNKIIDHESYGNLGEMKVKLEGIDLHPDDVKIQLLHTWTEHSPLELDDATFTSPSFSDASNVPYWIEELE